MPRFVIDTDEYYSADETASRVGIGVATVWRWIKADKIKADRVGGRTLIPKSEVDRLIKEQKEIK